MIITQGKVKLKGILSSSSRRYCYFNTYDISNRHCFNKYCYVKHLHYNTFRPNDKTKKSNNDISTKMNSILNTSFEHLQSYLEHKVLLEEKTEENEDSINKFELEFEDDLKNYEIHHIPNAFKSQCNELIDKNYGLSLPLDKQYKNFDNLISEINRTGDFDQRKILNLILRNKFSNYNAAKLINICSKLRYFKMVALILSMKPGLNIDTVLDSIQSDFQRYLILMETYNIQKDVNRILNCNLIFNDERRIGKFKYIYFMFMKEYGTDKELVDDIDYWNDNVGFDNDVNLMYHYKLIEFLKDGNKETLKLVCATIDDLVNKFHFYEIEPIITNFFNISNKELIQIYETEGNITDNFQFKTKQDLKTHILERLIKSTKLYQKDCFKFILLNCDGDTKDSDLINEYLYSNMGKFKVDFDKENDLKINELMILERLIKDMKNDVHQEEISLLFFNLLAIERKIKLFKLSIHEFLNTNNDIKLINVLILLKDETKYTLIIRKALKEIFSNQEEQGSKKIITFLHLILMRCPFPKIKEYIFLISSEILKVRVNKSIKKESWYELQELFNLLLKFQFQNINNNKKLITTFTPTLLKLLSVFKHNLNFEKEMSKAKSVFNATLDSICLTPVLLYELNPKAYESKIYIQRKGVVKDISNILLNEFNVKLLNTFFNSRIEYLSLNDDEWISQFKRNLDKFGIFLEVFIREKYDDHENELTSVSKNEHILKFIDSISGFKWELDLNKEDNEQELGYGIKEILEEISFKTNELEFSNLNEHFNVEIVHPIEELMSGEEEFKLAKNLEEDNGKVNLRQDIKVFKEIEEILGKFKDTESENKFRDKELNFIIKESKKRKYSKEHKLSMLRLYSPLRIKSMLFESLIITKPSLIDEVILKLHNDYCGQIPIILLHSIMIGLIKTEKLRFTEKIDLIKMIDKIHTIIYKDDRHSQMFKINVKFTDFKILLVELVIEESKRIDGGSIKTLNWAMRKIINLPNVDKYKKHLKKWNSELLNMRETRSGFFNDTFKNWQ